MQLLPCTHTATASIVVDVVYNPRWFYMINYTHRPSSRFWRAGVVVVLRRVIITPPNAKITCHDRFLQKLGQHISDSDSAVSWSAHLRMLSGC